MRELVIKEIINRLKRDPWLHEDVMIYISQFMCNVYELSDEQLLRVLRDIHCDMYR